MVADATLVTSSPTTRSWLHGLRDKLPQFQYRERKYWGSFRSTAPDRVIVYLNPSKSSIRLFLPLQPTNEPDLKSTPSSSNWATRFPSVFQIGNEHDLTTAAQLIVKAHAVILASVRDNAVNRPTYFAAEELSSEIEYVEGAVCRVLVNKYERNQKAREECLCHYGLSCAVCGFNFEARYGESAAGYIQVHHVVKLASVGKEYRVSPINDLRPVCANCHAVIHRTEEPYSIAQVKAMLKKDTEELDRE